MAELRRLGVALMTATKAVSISEGGVEVEKADGKGFIKADSVVLAMGSRAEAKIADDIRDLVQEVYVIGDAKEPRNALEAIREGFIVGLNI